jgi:DNA-directed RNA polymerase subunit RPC12/RpoP
MKENTFTKIATFPYSSGALILKGKIESEGIEVFMFDNNTIDTDPLLSNAIGGVKLFVHSENAEKASEIVSEFNKYSLNDNGEAIHCPKCNSEKIEFLTTIKDIKSLLAFIFSFVFVMFPIHTKYKYKCEDCNSEF